MNENKALALATALVELECRKREAREASAALDYAKRAYARAYDAYTNVVVKAKTVRSHVTLDSVNEQ